MAILKENFRQSILIVFYCIYFILFLKLFEIQVAWLFFLGEKHLTLLFKHRLKMLFFLEKEEMP